MKYTKLTIAGVPKSLVIWDVVDYVQDLSDDASPDDVQYDFYSLECVEREGRRLVCCSSTMSRRLVFM